jgi:hypothetical protein
MSNLADEISQSDLIDDIEELSLDSAGQDAYRRVSYRQVAVKRFRRKLDPETNENCEELNAGMMESTCGTSTDAGASNLFYAPGQARIYVKTWGCSHNNSDSGIVLD